MGLDADEGSPAPGLVVAAGHGFNDIGAQTIELFDNEIEPDILNRLEQVFPLNPERATIVPGGPPRVIPIAKRCLAGKLSKAASAEPLVFGARRQRKFTDARFFGMQKP